MAEVVAEVQDELQLQPAVAASDSSSSSRVWGDVVVALSSGCSPDQAVALLQVLQLPFWTTAFTIFISPVEGAFSYCRGTPLAKFIATATSEGVGSSKELPCCSFKKAVAAWQVVFSHYNHGEVVAELKHYQQQWEGEGAATAAAATAAAATAAAAADGGGGGNVTEMDGRGSGSKTSSSYSIWGGEFSALVGEVLAQYAVQPDVQAVHLYALMTVLPAEAVAAVAETLRKLSGVGKAQAKTEGGLGESALLQLLCFVSAHLPVDQVPSFLATAWDILQSSSGVAAAAGSATAAATAAAGLQGVLVAGFRGRPGWMLGELAARVVRGVPEVVARVLLVEVSDVTTPLSPASADSVIMGRLRAALQERVLMVGEGEGKGTGGRGVTDGDGEGEGEGECIWQLGQNPWGEGSTATATTSAGAVARGLTDGVLRAKEQSKATSRVAGGEVVWVGEGKPHRTAGTAAAAAAAAAAAGEVEGIPPVVAAPAVAGGAAAPAAADGFDDRVLDVLCKAVAGIPAAAPAGGSMDAMQVRGEEVRGAEEMGMKSRGSKGGG
jgi:hypothetical protein